VAALLTGYFMIPDRIDATRWFYVVVGLAGLVLFGWVFVRQLNRISTARFPVLRAVEAMALVATLFVVSVSTVHFVISTMDPAAYSEPLDRLDALYFTVTVLATVGFGDITPVSTEARALLTGQMVLGVVLLGAGVRVLFAVAKQRHGGAPVSLPD
jgi:hypothetical protein